jgi:predicted  nucleic acid-binding Zn-ribbon protein
MASDSKVDEILAGLRSEEERLKRDLADAEQRVRELKKEVAKLQSGIRGLRGGGSGSRRKSASRAGSADAAPAAGFEACCNPVVEFGSAGN